MGFFLKKIKQSEYQQEVEDATCDSVVYMASDHAGFHLKEELKKHIEENLGYSVKDFGARKFDKQDDYPDFISALALEIYNKKGKVKGIILGGSGQGEAIVANRHSYVRAGVVACSNPELVKLLREHNDANVLSLGARFINLNFAKQAVELFLNTPFSQEERHIRRINKIDSL